MGYILVLLPFLVGGNSHLCLLLLSARSENSVRILRYPPSVIFYLFIYFFFVPTITLENLNQSEPDFHT